MLGALLKMKMVGFRDDKFLKPTFAAFTAQVNPESYSLDHTIDLNKEQPSGSDGKQEIYIGMNPRRLSFEIIFDGTGAIGDAPASLAKAASVPAQIKLFKKTAYDYFGGSHRSPFVLLQWGSLLFQGQLESLSLVYKLFSPEGVPLRATARVAFKEVVADSLLTRLSNALSADLTHIRTVQAGDTLPLLCEQVYGDATLYSKVAEANQLVNFRRLRVGQQVAFPPLVPTDTEAAAA
ncbi:MAG TPA: LysM peptidoglycan-binding domain-containing protein [Hymenobacter sp.]|uniref:LysM peptidoglycan-binding domain-containing protein n=1 Tax=Hymenobacter sp. TaxID=1898978 RepID=UPI002D7E903C|nr:LysM peptidoglycan-binding domain-containing protein [Hymenobacter sp.]HET9503302.1 LysM peptidoglycan-binding domain-containing protein [Hymenobacter sp.]